MKNLKTKAFLLTLLLALLSCSNDDDNSNSSNTFDLNSTYIHLIEGCNNSGNLEMNCTESVVFNDSGMADVLIGGGDLIFQTAFDVNGSNVVLDQTSGLNFDITFTIIDENTLERNEDGELWIKN